MRPLTASQRWTKSRSTPSSASTPQSVWLVCGAIASDSPVPTASTNTRSEVSSRLSALSTYGNGTVCVVAGTPVTRRLGANDPRCSQAVADPGPPLKKNVTDRVAGAAPSAV